MFNFKEFSIIEGLKLPIKILIPIASVTGAILFLPTEVVSQLYLTDFKEQWGFVIGIIFLISTAISIQELLIKGYKKCENYYYKKKFKEIQPKILKRLSLQEVTVVTLLNGSPGGTLFLPINNGIVVKLENKKVISKTTSQCGVSDLTNPMFPYTLNTWVESIFRENEEVLVGYEAILEENKEEVEEIIDSLGAFDTVEW